VGKGEGAVMEDFDEPENSWANLLKFLNNEFDFLRWRKFSKAAKLRQGGMNATTTSEDGELVAGILDIKSIMEELVLLRILVVKVKQGVFLKEIGEDEDIEMKGMITNDEAIDD